MSDLVRYHTWGSIDSCLYEHPEGLYVDYDDYASLEAKYNALLRQVDELETRVAMADGALVKTEKWLRAWANRFVLERTEKYRSRGDDFEISRAKAEIDANSFADALGAALEDHESGGEGAK